MKIFVIKWQRIVAAALACSFLMALCSAVYWRDQGVLPVGGTLSPAQRSLPIYSVETEEKALSLGINCAWDNEDIPVILKVLHQRNVTATFFILGEWAEKYPESVLAISSAGHEIASHSYTHRDLTQLSAEEIASESNLSMQALEKITGKKPSLLRPPSGAYNNLVIDTIKAQGYIPLQWDVDSLDWKGLTPDEILLRIMARSHEGSILLLHSGAAHTAEALPAVIDSLSGSGFHFLPVGELLYQPPYEINSQGRQYVPGS